ncbi:MAG: hypothetical protein JW716_01065 [Candidatus Aenigmarchaeota archaeon]|nr:hypothetical protein [Candidatus Aenigmarchaeota archaeon]
MDDSKKSDLSTIGGEAGYRALTAYMKEVCSRLNQSTGAEYDNLVYRLTGKTAAQRAKEREENHK